MNEKREAELTLELHSYQNNQEDTMKIVRHSLSILEDIGSVWLRVDLEVKKRFQKFLFPQGLPFNGENFGTPILAYCIKPNWSITPQKSLIVPPAGVEPAIFGMRIRCPRPLDDGGASQLY